MIKDATLKRFNYDDHDQLRNHMANCPPSAPMEQFSMIA